MYDRLQAMVESIARFESLVEEYDEALSTYYTFEYKMNLVRKFAFSDETKQLVDDLANKVTLYKNILEGARSTAIDETGMTIEQLRSALMQARVGMNRIVNLEGENMMKAVAELTSEEVLNEVEGIFNN